MHHVNLDNLFGANAYQTDNFLVINKANFATLTATSENTGESLLIAILLNAANYFKGVIVDEQGIAIMDEQGIAITYSNLEAYQTINVKLWKTQLLQGQKNIIDSTFIVDIFNEI